MQNQSSLWLNVRRDRPDWIYMQGFGAMNPTAVKEAIKINYPMEHLDRQLVGRRRRRCAPGRPAARRAIWRSSFNQTGTDFPVMQDILKHVVDKGKSLIAKEKVGETLYNRGVVNSIIIAEAIRNAQQISGKKEITGEDMRRGLETLEISAARLKEIGRGRLRGADEGRRAPTTTATTRPSWRSGTAPSATRRPTGSSR